MWKKIDDDLKIGEKIGFLTILGDAPSDKCGRRYVTVQCLCGVVKDVYASHLRLGEVISCGHFHRRQLALQNYIHGHARRNHFSFLYDHWRRKLNTREAGTFVQFLERLNK